MTLSRWHVVVVLAVVLFLVAALTVGNEGGRDAMLDQVGSVERGTSLRRVKDVVTIIGVIIAAVSLVFTALNTRQTRLTDRASFWLDLRDQFAKHNDVHRLLRPRGDWSGAKGGPAKAEEWAQVEAYMGLFEHCEIMLDQGLIDEKTFKEIYEYRLRNIVANDTIRREKLCNPRLRTGWTRFLALLKRMGIEVDC
jgi:hypothetical protein